MGKGTLAPDGGGGTNLRQIGISEEWFVETRTKAEETRTKGGGLIICNHTYFISFINKFMSNYQISFLKIGKKSKFNLLLAKQAYVVS
ncbi:MAG: hypothetical protein IPF72_13655 [Chitinophagaceae bacterium]|nr:hypothetical protein [Chitinophagaceae bacterium]